MSLLRARAAVSPLRRVFADANAVLPAVDDLIAVERPEDPVHCVRLMKDNTLFVCDRANNRIQVFEKSGKFIREMVFEPDTKGSGSVWDLIPSDASQKYILIADGTNNEVTVMVRDTGQKVGSFGRSGRNAGEFHWVHNIAVDSEGSVYTTEVDTGKRAQRFVTAK